MLFYTRNRRCTFCKPSHNGCSVDNCSYAIVNAAGLDLTSSGKDRVNGASSSSEREACLYVMARHSIPSTGGLLTRSWTIIMVKASRIAKATSCCIMNSLAIALAACRCAQRALCSSLHLSLSSQRQTHCVRVELICPPGTFLYFLQDPGRSSFVMPRGEGP